MANDHTSEGGTHTLQGCSSAPEGRFGEGHAQASSRQGQLRRPPGGHLLFEEADDVPLGWDASRGSDAGLEVEADLLVLPTLTDPADAGSEWGSEGALARALLASALTDVAPPTVRERVLSAVDAALFAALDAGLYAELYTERCAECEGESGAAFPAEAAPVTTLSGVFEKRRPASETASCVESSLQAVAVDASGQQPPMGRNSAVASFDPACVQVRSSCTAVSCAAVSCAAVSCAAVSCAAVSCAAALPELVSVDAGAHGSDGPVHRRAGGRPMRAVPLSDRRAIKGLVGARPTAPLSSSVLSSSVLSSSVLSSSVLSSSVLSSSVLSSSVLSSSVLSSSALSSGLLEPLAAPERSRLGRLRDGVVASAFNLAQLVAAIVVGVAIGKAGHLLTGEEPLAASNPIAKASGGVRGQPSHGLDAVRGTEPSGASGPRADRSWSSEPTHVATAAGSWQSEPTNAASMPRPRALSSKTRSGPARARAPRSFQPVQGSASARQLASNELTGNQLTGNQLTGNARPAVAPVSEDWLGEQLVILERAERSLLEGDPENAVRSLDEYQSRFPDGLLNLQMASVRRRAGGRAVDFIFP